MVQTGVCLRLLFYQQLKGKNIIPVCSLMFHA